MVTHDVRGRKVVGANLCKVFLREASQFSMSTMAIGRNLTDGVGANLCKVLLREASH